MSEKQLIHVFGLTCIQHVTEVQERGLDITMWTRLLCERAFASNSFTPETVAIIVTVPVCCSAGIVGREEIANKVETNMRLRKAAQEN